jgi:hypothetical protein
MKHLGVGYRPFPATLDMKKSHIEVTYSEGIGCEGTIAIT